MPGMQCGLGCGHWSLLGGSKSKLNPLVIELKKKGGAIPSLGHPRLIKPTFGALTASDAETVS